jgi:hypothetical protein
MKKILEGVQRREARFVTGNYRNHSPGSMTHVISCNGIPLLTVVEHLGLSCSTRSRMI